MKKDFIYEEPVILGLLTELTEETNWMKSTYWDEEANRENIMREYFEYFFGLSFEEKIIEIIDIFKNGDPNLFILIELFDFENSINEYKRNYIFKPKEHRSLQYFEKIDVTLYPVSHVISTIRFTFWEGPLMYERLKLSLQNNHFDIISQDIASEFKVKSGKTWIEFGVKKDNATEMEK